MRLLRFLSLILSLIYTQVFAQEEDYVLPTETAFDQVYIHTDRPNYFLNDTLWMKAYAWAAVAGKGLKPSKSHTLYLELQKQITGEAVFQTSILLKDGLGEGQISLNGVPEGDYVLVAQTKSMAEWEKDYIFQRPIKISEVGVFQLARPAGLQTDNGPVPFQNGMRIGLNPSLPSYQLIIERSQTQADSIFQLIGIQHGRLVYEQYFFLNPGKSRYSLSLEPFSPGLVDFALLDQKGEILAERPVFIHPQGSPTLKVVTDKTQYSPKEKVVVDFVLEDGSGIGIEGDISISVFDSKQVAWSADMPSIVTEMMLGSALGSPFYFSNSLIDDDPRDSKKAVNDLLSRKSSQTALSKYGLQAPKPTWEEPGITLRGTAKDKFGSYLRAGMDLEFLFYPKDGGPFIAYSKVGEKGSFELQGLAFIGEASVIARQVLARRNGTYSEVLEKSQLSFEQISLPKTTVQDRFVSLQETEDLNDVRRYSLIRNARAKDRMIELDTITVEDARKSSDQDMRGIMLGDIPDFVLEPQEGAMEFLNVFQYMRGRVAGLIMVGDASDIGNPPMVFFRQSQVGQMGWSALSESQRTGAGSEGGAVFFLDGVQTNRVMIATLLMSEVERIEILKTIASQNILGTRTSGAGAINVVTRRSNPDQSKFRDENVVFANGYLEPIAFPVHATGILQKDPFLVNYDATVYWNPNVKTDIAGKGNVEFVLNDLQTEFTVVVEGMSKSGQPIFGKYTFSVKE